MIDTAIVRRVIELARFRENAYRTYMNTHFPNDPTIDLGADHHLDSKEFQQYNKYDRELIHYLLELNYENVLDLEALMFLGRGDDSSFSAARILAVKGRASRLIIFLLKGHWLTI